MKYRFLAIAFFSFAQGFCSIYNAVYPVSTIPEELMEGAHTVFRLDKGEVIIENIDRVRFRHKVAVTILNEKGNRNAVVTVGYDKLIKIVDFDASVYDQAGTLIKKMKKEDVIDQSNISGGTLFDDSRVRGADLSQEKYPYTVVYEYEILYKYLYSLPNWIVLDREKTAVEKSEYTISAPKDKGLDPRFKLLNTDQEPRIDQVDGTTSYSWLFENIRPYEYEAYSKGYLDVSPIVYVAPSKFKYDDYEGDMSSWDGLAKWQNELNAGRDVLSPETIKNIRNLVSGLDNDLEKAKKVYEYMQSKTRYVSVQLGIGGFQPFEAQVVDEVGYGDCKALTFYTQALLKQVGIESYYTWVEAGNNPGTVYPDFPNDTFNHIILFVPLQSDTVWLECTNQTIPFGYLGDFTEDRDVVVMTNSGASIVHTPSYDLDKNKISATANVKFDVDGNAEVAVNSIFHGGAYGYEGLDYYSKLQEEDKRRWLQNYISIGNYEIRSYEFVEKKAMMPEMLVKMDLDVRKLASQSGKRWFFQPNLISAVGNVPKSIEERKNPVYINNSIVIEDSIVFEWPEIMSIEQVPESTELMSEFGSFNVQYSVNENVLIYKRKIILNKGVFEASKYAQLFDFFRSMQKADKKKVVLINKT